MDDYLVEKQKTIASYNRSAAGLAKKFDEIGIREEDIRRAFNCTAVKNPKVLEIGCGNGRDARGIIKYASDYLGIDVSEKMVELAKQNCPQGRFLVAEAEDCQFPENLDIIFAFASLLHIPDGALDQVMEKSFKALKTDGIFYISLKFKGEHKEIKEDGFGSRVFYHHSPDEIRSFEKLGFKEIYHNIQTVRGQQWFVTILKKQ